LSRIDKIESEGLLKGYVETRLKLAGGARQIFADDAYGFLWEYSEHGVPRLINKMCKLSLKAGETNEFMQVSGEVVRQIGERFRHLTGPAIPKRKPRKRSDGEVVAQAAEKEAVQASDDHGALSVEAFKERRRTKDAEGSQEKEIIAEKERTVDVPAPSLEERTLKNDISVEVEVGGLKFAVNIPHHIFKQAQSSTHEHRMKIAGTLAAQIMKKHEELVAAPSVDPISMWSELRELIAGKLK
jgi:hypothetical protein